MTLRGEIAAFYASYAEAFSRFDADAVSNHWDVPALIVSAKRTVAFDAETFRANTEGLFAFYRRQGVARATAEVLSADAPFPDLATVRVLYTMLDQSGATITAFEGVYMLRRTSAGWRAASGVPDGEMAAWAARGTPLGR